MELNLSPAVFSILPPPKSPHPQSTIPHFILCWLFHYFPSEFYFAHTKPHLTTPFSHPFSQKLPTKLGRCVFGGKREREEVGREYSLEVMEWGERYSDEDVDKPTINQQTTFRVYHQLCMRIHSESLLSAPSTIYD